MRTFFKYNIFLAFLVFSGNLLIAQAELKPNIIFIVVDDLNDYIEELGGLPSVETPNINRISAKGTLFTNTICAAPLCCPSRTSFLTGKDPAYTGIYSAFGYKCNNFSLNFTAAKNNDEYFTIPGYLKDSAGYFTYGLNKIFHCYENYQEYDDETIEACNKELSWNKIFVYNDSVAILPGVNIEEQGVTGNEWSAINDTLENYLMDYVAVDSTIKFIKEVSENNDFICEKPFFIALGIKKPHNPLYIPQKYFKSEYVTDFYAEPFDIPFHFPKTSYPLNGIVMPPQPEIFFGDYYALPTDSMGQNMIKGADNNFIEWAEDLSPTPILNPAFDEAFNLEMLEWTKRSNCIIAYLAAVKYLDAQIGRLLDSLELYPEIYNNTVIVFTSDNGYSLSEKKHWGKRAMWETDIRVPLIVADLRNPEKQICNATINMLDIFPTFCDIAGEPYPKFSDGSNYLDGKSLFHYLEDPTDYTDRPVLSSVIKEQESEGSCFPQYSIRNNRFHYIRYKSNGGGETTCDSINSYIEEEFYEIGENREVDPNEWNNLIKNPDYNSMINYLQQWLPDSAMFGKSAYKVQIINDVTDCYLSYTDTIPLQFEMFDSAGYLIVPPESYIYQWTNNLTSDTILETESYFALDLIPEFLFNSSEKLIMTLQIMDTLNHNILGIDLEYFYINTENEPTANFSILNTDPVLYINDFSTTGIYTNKWWKINGDSSFFNQVPEEIIIDSPFPHTITCFLEYGNTGCIVSFTETAYAPLTNYFKDEVLYVIPNPAHHNVTIYQKSGIQGGWLELINLNGEIVMRLELGENAGTNYYTFDASEISNGAYILSIKNQQSSTSSPIIIMR